MVVGARNRGGGMTEEQKWVHEVKCPERKTQMINSFANIGK